MRRNGLSFFCNRKADLPSISLLILHNIYSLNLFTMPSSLSFCSKTSSVLVAMVTIWLLAFCADIGAGFLVTSTFYSNPLRLHKLKAYRIYNDHTAVMSRVPVKESSEQPLISEDDIEYSHGEYREFFAAYLTVNFVLCSLTTQCLPRRAL